MCCSSSTLIGAQDATQFLCIFSAIVRTVEYPSAVPHVVTVKAAPILVGARRLTSTKYIMKMLQQQQAFNGDGQQGLRSSGVTRPGRTTTATTSKNHKNQKNQKNLNHQKSDEDVDNKKINKLQFHF